MKKINILLLLATLNYAYAAFPEMRVYKFSQASMIKIKDIFINYKVYLSDNLEIDDISKLKHISNFKLDLVADRNIMQYIKTEDDVIKAGNSGGLFLKFKIGSNYFYAKFAAIKYLFQSIEDFSESKDFIKKADIVNLQGNGIWLYKNAMSYDISKNDDRAIFVALLGFKDKTNHSYFMLYNPENESKNINKNFKTTLISFEEFKNGIREGLFLIPNPKAILEMLNLRRSQII